MPGPGAPSESESSWAWASSWAWDPAPAAGSSRPARGTLHHIPEDPGSRRVRDGCSRSRGVQPWGLCASAMHGKVAGTAPGPSSTGMHGASRRSCSASPAPRGRPQCPGRHRRPPIAAEAAGPAGHDHGNSGYGSRPGCEASGSPQLPSPLEVCVEGAGPRHGHRCTGGPHRSHTLT